MKLHKQIGKINPFVAVLYDHIDLTISFSKDEWQKVGQLADKIRELDDVDIEVKQHREKRSLDANSKAWVLIGKIARKQGISATEVYRQEIRDMPTYDILPIRDDAVERFKQNWESQGTGWLCDSLGASKFKGYTNLKCHYGSSTFNTKEMSDFIDKIIMDCRELGIETDSPDEIEKIKNLWGGR